MVTIKKQELMDIRASIKGVETGLSELISKMSPIQQKLG
jgi:hypothetical protein